MGAPARSSVGDAELLAMMDRGLDLVDNRGREVGAGDVGAAFRIEERDLVAHPVRAGPGGPQRRRRPAVGGWPVQDEGVGYEMRKGARNYGDDCLPGGT